MKTSRFFRPLATALIAMNVLASCNNDGSSPDLYAEAIQELYETEYYYSEDVLWNNEEKIESSFRFIQPEEKTGTAVIMQLTNPVPCESGYLDIPLDMVYDETTLEMDFSGEIKGENYELAVDGTFYRPKPHMDLQPASLVYTYRATDDIPKETPYIFNIDDGLLQLQGGLLLGQEDLFNRITAELRRKVTAMRWTFHEDGTLEVWHRPAGETNFTPWSTYRYWVKGNDELYLSFSYRQYEDHLDCWYGKRPNGYSPPFIVMFENWDYLLAMHYRIGEQFSWSIMPPYDGSAMSLYISCKEEEGFSREYIDELLDWKILTDRLDVHTWIVSE